MVKLLRTILIVVCGITLIGCASYGKNEINQADLQQGKRLFAAGMYKRSMKWLLPLATDGSAEAQYAVGYMYYYGYGVTQDTETGTFWIQRSANKGYKPAQDALAVINKQGNPG